MRWRYVSTRCRKVPPQEASGVAQWPTGEGRAVPCLGSGEGATGCEWHRWPKFSTESLCWGCDQPETPAQGSQAAGRSKHLLVCTAASEQPRGCSTTIVKLAGLVAMATRSWYQAPSHSTRPASASER